MLTAGLAMSDSPRAGKQLFERRGKRIRREWMQTLSNILYIKIPIFDPEKVLKVQLKFMGWIFSLWFFTLSVLFMGAAAMLVATAEAFRSKLRQATHRSSSASSRPSTSGRLLGVVKVITENTAAAGWSSVLRSAGAPGEEDLLEDVRTAFIAFSPAAAVTASATPGSCPTSGIASSSASPASTSSSSSRQSRRSSGGTRRRSRSSTTCPCRRLAMIVCGVSTVVFNANPLMRYDGYYVLSDWLEIPNLREKANRYLKNILLAVCLGVEIPAEEYMEVGRKVLFIVFAVVSYVYRWVVTFGILYLFYTFLRPYKLEMIGNLLTLAAICSMTIWPVYRMGKNIYQRGRLPDMKRKRVLITSAAVAALVLILALVPMPISRIRGLAVVQPHPDASSQVVLKRSAILVRLKVQPGEEVTRTTRSWPCSVTWTSKAQLRSKLSERDIAREYVRSPSLNSVPPRSTRTRTQPDRARKWPRRPASRDPRQVRSTRSRSLAQQEELVILAPRDGIIGQGPKARGSPSRRSGNSRDQGNQSQPLFTIHSPEVRCRLCPSPLVTSDYNQLKQNLEALPRRGAIPSFTRTARDAAASTGWTIRPGRAASPASDQSEAKYIPLPALEPGQRPRSRPPAFGQVAGTGTPDAAPTSSTSTSPTPTRRSPSATWPR